MDYVDAAQKGSSTVLYGVRYFQLAQTLDCGQAFRWHESRVGEFSGIAHGRRLNLFLNGDELTLEDVSLDEFEQIWKKYFGFDYDYHWLRAVLSKTQQGVLTPRQSFALQNFATPLEKGVTPPSQTNNLIGG
ncbi:MAG: 8-oxoguanine DNA glycosylase, N-terminal domain-containing protein, partial [Defluviitaleaceae bacterium]|nr:8-oxoguanine DNA glycosylase, N-terminal domain-containing protein [Defluviitaleaceae bacterium]